MNSDFSTQRSLVQLVARGISGSAGKLSEISRVHWQVQASSIQADRIDHFQSLLAADESEYLGVYLSMPDGLFLVIFSMLSASVLGKAFVSADIEGTRPVSSRERQALCEIASILVNPIADALADACDMGFFLSMPEIVRDNKSKLLAQMPEKIKDDGGHLAIKADIHVAQTSLASDCTVIILLGSHWEERMPQ